MAFIDGPINDLVVRPLVLFSDERGWLAELFRDDELPADLRPAMAYLTSTHPGAIRGPHEHVGQSDYFAAAGPGEFEFVCWDARTDSTTFGRRMRFRAGAEQPCVVTIPPGVVHAFRNVGDAPGLIFNAPNRLYAGPGRNEPVDEIRHELNPQSPYLADLRRLFADA